ncbi:glycosyltransferase, partial [Bacillus cereus]
GPIIREEIKNGSQGSERINQILQATLDKLLMQFNSVHIFDKGKMNPSLQAEGYRQFEYLDKEISDIIAMEDLVISRAGSSTVSELIVLKKPTILIPLSSGSSRGDQIINAEFCKRNKYAKVLLQENMDEAAFIKSIEDLYRKRKQYI